MQVRRLWPWLYTGLFLAGLLTGAGVFGHEDLSRANIDAYFLMASLAVGLLFPFLAMWQSHSKKLTPVPSPSFMRAPIGGWWRDPFQWLRICILAMVGAFVGTLMAWHGAGGQGAMFVYWKGSLALGFLAGDFLARRAFRRDIS